MAVALLVLATAMVASAQGGSSACTSPGPCALRLNIVAKPDPEGRSDVQAKLEQSADRDDWALHTDMQRIPGEGSNPATDVLTLTLTGRSGGGGGGGDWVRVPGMGAYLVHTEARPWLGAALACAAEGDGAHLAVPDSPLEAREIARLLRPLERPGTSPFFHVGVSDLAQEGAYVTVTGKTWTQEDVTFWGSRQPNGGRWQNCLSMRTNAKVYDDWCHSNYAFICERPV